ncbi:Proteasome activator complex subunit 4 [Grifola frondosa]|uniref:Proteasome activator complex subunit 4 n=1 Tax=Grifola frondosa TaxID=5627 RepID=A0A1C7MS91_GRIFR|nr:Proteasome activator complex subunit 4 [Grifola frondosa]
MNIPDISSLSINDKGRDRPPLPHLIPDDILHATDHYMIKLRNYAKSIPYCIEPYSHMQEMLDFILLRISQCVEAKDYDPGLIQWDSMLTYWSMLKYPIPKDKRIALAKLYFQICTTPGMPNHIVANCADSLQVLTRSKKKMSIEDMRLPWKPIFKILSKDLFLTRRQFEISQTSWYMGYIADNVRRFFHPAAIDEMLSTFVPMINGTSLSSMLASQYYMLTFLPLSHPQSYLPMLFRLWGSINSYMYDDRMLQFLARLAEMHVDPNVSDPRRIEAIPDDARSEDEERPNWPKEDIEIQWQIPLADAGSLTTGPNADNQATFELNRLPKANWRIASLARIIVYSMAPDGTPNPGSTAPTPFFTPFASGASTPLPRQNGGTYLAGCKALDSLAKLIASTESFFHPTNSGSWTSDLSAFVKYIVYDFNKRKHIFYRCQLALIRYNLGWYEEQEPDCKTPMHRRLTQDIKRELVKSLRTVTLLAMFSQDNTTVSNIQSCMKSMSIMEPDLILHPILERAVPALEALVETHRTTAVIKALGAVAPALVCRDIYYPGAKHLIPILELLLPGIDMNDPPKTFCTTAFISEVSQYIKFGELMRSELTMTDVVDGTTLSLSEMPSLNIENYPDGVESSTDAQLSKENEDALLKDTSGSFADWVASFLRRVILLFENLPEEGSNGGTTEVHLVDAVSGAFSQICVHLSEPLYDMVLNMVFDYASTNVRPNAVRAIHQLVECIANANPAKTLARFLPFCDRSIRTELEHGASSLRITSSGSTPLPSDATLHWNLAILRGAMFNDGRALTWHVPNTEEIDFVLQIFRDLIEPTLNILDGLLESNVTHDAVWRNDFCRHLSFVRNAFSGVPTLVKEFISPEESRAAAETSDILNEIPEMIASIQPLNSGFALSDPADPRHQYITSLRHRFGEFLHRASVSLRQQGEENTVDAMRSIRTYLLDYYVQADRYSSELNVARHYANQKVWPRALFVRRARLYHAARLHWNSIERRRSVLEDMLIDDITEWAMWNYATVRETSQALLENLCNNFDGVRRRCLPIIYKALEPGTEDDRMKGALWTLNSSIFAKYACGGEPFRISKLPEYHTISVDLEPTLATELLKKLFGCQHNEKPSIQSCVTSLSETCLSSFLEPCYVVYDIDDAAVAKSVEELNTCIPATYRNHQLVARCKAKRETRLRLMNAAVEQTTEAVLEIANNPETHWRYAIVAVRCLRTLVRRDGKITSPHIRYLLQKTYDPHSSMRYYAQRAIMKTSRFIKLRTFAQAPVDLALEQNHNPLRRQVPIIEPTQEFTSRWLAEYRVPLDMERARREPLLREKISSGWLAWDKSVDCFVIPDPTKSPFEWDVGSRETLAAIREVVNDSSYWKQLSAHYSAENHAEVIVQDNVSCVKSIFQLLEDEPFEALRPTLEELIADSDKNKQRAAAEFLAGIFTGSKHWPTDKQLKLWEWFVPHMKTLFSQKSNDNLPIWASFLECMFFNKDPRRVQPLADYIMDAFTTMDFNGESTFDIIQVLCFFRAVYEQLGLKFAAWTEDTLKRCWSELKNEHEDVLAYFSEIFVFCGKVMWRPNPSIPTVETVIRECRTLSPDIDIMGSRGTYHEGRVLELAKKFPVWRQERLPGVRAFQSTYDRVGILVCKWLFQSIHDTNAVSTFDYILPLMPELVRFTEINDNDDLSLRAELLLVRMCGVCVPRQLINPILDGIFTAIQSSPSWRVRLKILPLVQVFYFRQAPLLSDVKIVEMMEVVCRCLDDEVVEVREMAGTTLSGILRLSPRRSVIALKDRFVRLVKNSKLPDKQSPTYNSAMRQLHAAILGICALIDSYPYTVEKWMPELLTNVLAEHTYDPMPVSTTVRKCASNFRKTHQDTWHEDSKRFTEDQLAALSTLLTGSSYYA